MKTCEALGKPGTAVELVVPRRLNPIKDDPFAFYGVAKNFKITRLWCLDLISLNIFGPLGFWIESWMFYRAVKKYLKQMPADIYYTRDLPIAYWFSRHIRPLFYEIHTLPDTISKKYRAAWQRCQGLIVISNGLKEELVRCGVAVSKILVAHDAVDVAKFQISATRQECREQLSLPRDQKMVVYTGHLYEWKGAGTLAEAAKLLPADVHVYLVGGTAEDMKRFKSLHQSSNLHIVEWQKHEMIPFWLRAADILVLPNSAKSSIGAKYTSPLKAFEYIAAGRPIVASRLPALYEALEGVGMALFVDPDDANKLANGIQDLLTNEQAILETRNHSQRETELRDYSWENRARNIIEFLRARI